MDSMSTAATNHLPAAMIPRIEAQEPPHLRRHTRRRNGFRTAAASDPMCRHYGRLFRVAAIVAHAVTLPFAAPFVSGSLPVVLTSASSGVSRSSSSSSSSAAPSPTSRALVQQQQHQSQQQQPQGHPAAATRTSLNHAASPLLPSSSSSSTSLSSSLSLPAPSDPAGAPSLLRRVADFASGLLYVYAAPLVDQAKGRRLEAADSLPLPQHYRMDPSVERLEHLYDTLQHEHRSELQALKYPAPTTLDPASSSSTSSSSAAAAAISLLSEADDQQRQHDLQSKQSRLLIRALLAQQKGALLSTGVLRLLNTLIQAVPPVLVKNLLELIEAGADRPAYLALRTALALVAVLSVKMVLENQFFHHVTQFSTNVRGSVAGLVFDKSLRLAAGGSGVAHRERGVSGALGTGGVLNLVQSDAGMIETAATQLHTIWDGPLQMAVFSTLLFRYLGPSVLWGMAVLLVTIPVNSVALRILNRLARYENEAKDARTRRTAESIRNMKLLKLQGWEKRFEDDIRESRTEELLRHATRGVIRALNTAFSNAVPSLVLVVTLTAYVKTGQPLVASTIFTAIALFNQLRFPLFFYPMLIDSLANGKVAIGRVSSFLSAEEMIPYVTRVPIDQGDASAGGSIELTNGNFLWPTQKSTSSTQAVAPALVDATLRVSPGEVVAVVGGVGSGKSALLKALLGELTPAPRTIVQQAVSASLEAAGQTDRRPHAHVPEKSRVVSHGNISYCSQEAWLPKGPIRDAVVFGRDYDEARYRAALYDAGLDKDVASGVLRDDTDVGEGGSSLSGGQRARVALARALYAGNDTKVFLLDDCLAALDASVGSTVFERLTKRLRRTNAAAVIVTNDPSIPRRCDRVVLMEKLPSSSSCAKILDVGTYDELLSRGHDLRRSTAALPTGVEEGAHHPDGEVTAHFAMSSEASPQLTRVVQKTIRVVGGYEGLPNCTESTCHAEPDSQTAMECYPNFIADNVVPVSPEIKDDDSIFKEVANETVVRTPEVMDSIAERTTLELKDTPTNVASADDSMSTGAVPLATYASYFKSVRSPLLIAAVIGSYLMANGAQFFQQYTIAKWTEATHGVSAAASAVIGAKYMASLVNAAIVISIFLWLRSFLTMRAGVRASDFLHSRMLSSVFAAPMSFFDATPSGQLLSRFGKEIETVDRGIPDSIASVLFCFLQIFMSIGALVGIVTPAMMVPLAIVSVFYVRAMSLFRPAARDMKRAETKTRSPIFTHFGEALRGTDIIRSVPGAMQTWSQRHRSLSDENLKVYYSVKALDRWLSTRLETLGNAVVFAVAIASVLMTRSGGIKAGFAGWALTQSLAITGLLTWAVRCLTDLETNMMSLQRVRELTDLDSEEVDLRAMKSTKSLMPKELSHPGEALEPLLTSNSFNATLAPLGSASLKDDGWPWYGNVRFFNVSMRYSPGSPLVLNGVTLQVPAGTTLGVVGRTGSGKSSLLLTLFRLVEIEVGGRIEIDGVDLRSVSLETLRQSLAIIPQEPVLFAGSVAYNLDATGTASDADMWSALESASPSLARQFRKSDGLLTQVSEGGKNLSLGQRQLICLARALLRKSRILVLDEATSSVDSKTDQEVQETIKREFVNKGATVITVAHRLDTVLGYDRIAVMGAGCVLEFGAPSELLKIPGGELRRLVEADRQSKRKGAARQPAVVSAS